MPVAPMRRHALARACLLLAASGLARRLPIRGRPARSPSRQSPRALPVHHVIPHARQHRGDRLCAGSRSARVAHRRGRRRARRACGRRARGGRPAACHGVRVAGLARVNDRGRARRALQTSGLRSIPRSRVEPRPIASTRARRGWTCGPPRPRACSVVPRRCGCCCRRPSTRHRCSPGRGASRSRASPTRPASPGAARCSTSRGTSSTPGRSCATSTCSPSTRSTCSTCTSPTTRAGASPSTRGRTSRPTAAAPAVNGDRGGFYTKAQYREIVEYAAARFITVVPEIDMPGHTNAALASYPELNCDDTAPALYTGIKVGFSALCVGKDVTYRFIEDVIGELAALTPGPYMHIGGDEVKTTDAGRLRRVHRARPVDRRAPRQAGDRLGGDRPRHAGADDGGPALARRWRRRRRPRRAVRWRRRSRQGARVVMSPASRVYLDMKYDAADDAGAEVGRVRRVA